MLIKKPGPIGVFDSGVGGLTVLRAFLKKFTNYNYLYFGDTARVPYGNRSPENIRRFALQGCRFLQENGAKIIIVACNSASANAMEHLRKNLNIPVFGVIEPGAVEAVKKTKKGQVAIIGTRATVNSKAYLRKISELDGKLKCIQKACPLFVPLAEEGMFKGDITERVIKLYLSDIKGKVDTVLLGCTHYPLLKKAISEYLGKTVRVIDSATSVVKHVSPLLEEPSGGEKAPSIKFFVTDNPGGFLKIGKKFLGRPIARVETVDIQRLELAAG